MFAKQKPTQGVQGVAEQIASDGRSIYNLGAIIDTVQVVH